MRILVLLGGNSPEREVSLASGEAVAKGLDEKGHQVLKMDPANPEKVYTMTESVFKGSIAPLPQGEDAALTPEQVVRILDNIKKYSIDLVFPALHGGWGEDGRLQALLEMTNIPFAGSGACASALAMNKHLSKRIAASLGIPVPDYFFLPRTEIQRAINLCSDFGCPLVVKPNAKGSSVGVTIVKEIRALAPALEAVQNLNDDLIIERYIAGREITVGILDGGALAALEIVPKDGFYDYHHKYTAGQTEYICPAPISPDLTEKARQYAAAVFNLMECKVFGRVDFRMNKKGEMFFLEVNTIPGMTSSASLLPKTAAAVGMNFPELVNRIVVSSMNLKR